MAITPRPSNLVDLLRSQAARFPDRLIFTFLKDGENKELELTFAELDVRARAIGAELQKHGACGERVLLCFAPSLEYITSFFGCLYAGAIAVPVYPPDPSRLSQSLAKLQPILKSSGARFALTTTQLQLLTKFIPGKSAEMKALSWIATDRIFDSSASKWIHPDVQGGSLAFLQYTSGSTGDPKGVMVSHGNLMHNLGAITDRLKLTPKDVGVIWVPPYHDLGLIGGILLPVFTGFRVILFSPLDFLKKPLRWLQAITKYKATISGGPSFGYDYCVRKITDAEKCSLDLSTLHTAFIGAEPVYQTTLERFNAAFGECGFEPSSFYPTYGLAEGTLLAGGATRSTAPKFATVDKKELESDRLVFCEDRGENTRTFVGNGHGLDDQTTIIVDPERLTTCEPGQVGEIWISSPSVAQGYWNRPEDTEKLFRATPANAADQKRFLRTGDLGFLHDNQIYITGRLKDLIIIRGKNHYPQDLEMVAHRSHKSLRQGCCVAFANERLVIVAELSRGANPDASHEVVEAIREAVMRENEVRVEAVTLIEAGSLPKTSSGKVQRRATQARYLNDELKTVYKWELGAIQQAEPPRAESEDTASSGLPFEAKSVDWVLQLLSSECGLPANEIRLDQKLVDDLGFDSLMLVTVHVEVSALVPGIELSDFTRETTVEDVVKAILTLGSVPASTRPARTSGAPDGVAAPESYRFELFPEYLALQERFRHLNTVGTSNPYFKVHEDVSRDTIKIAGRELVNFSGYNYLGLSGHRRVSEASKRAIDIYGTSVSASRVASGEIPLHREFEQEMAEFLGTEDAILFIGGHPTNVTTIGHLVGAGDLILHDSLSHDSIIQGCLLSGAQRRPFPHNNTKALDKILTKLRPYYRRVLICIEGVYSMDGDIAHLPEFIALKKKHHALLFVDEAHSIGTLGKTGRGVVEHFGVSPKDVDVLMGTLSKSFATCGGYIAGSKALVELLKYTAPGFVFSVGIPPSNVAAALESLRVLREDPARVATLHARSALFLKLAKDHGLDTGLSNDTQIVPVIVGSSANSLLLAAALHRRGINAQPIMYPAVAENEARIRFFITSLHTEAQLRHTADVVAEELAKLRGHVVDGGLDAGNGKRPLGAQLLPNA